MDIDIMPTYATRERGPSKEGKDGKTAKARAPTEPRLPVELKDVEPKDPQFAYTLFKGLKILEAFNAASYALGNKEFCAATQLGKSTVSRLTRTLVSMGYLRPVSGKKYQLGPAVLSLAYPLLANLPVRKHGHVPMQELATAMHGVVTLGVFDRNELVFVESCRNVRTMVTKPEIGARRELTSTPAGQVYLASLDKDARAALVRNLPLPGGQDRAEVLATIERREKELKTAGYCFSSYRGLNTISAPVHSSVPGEVYVLNCAVEDLQLNKSQMIAKVPPVLFSTINRIEQALGVDRGH